MRAPVYRNLDGQSTLLGLAFPGEALVVLSAVFALFAFAPPGVAAALSVLLYVAARLAARRKAPKYLQHWVLFRLRQRATRGRLSAAARAPAPRLPVASYSVGLRDFSLRDFSRRDLSLDEFRRLGWAFHDGTTRFQRWKS